MSTGARARSGRWLVARRPLLPIVVATISLFFCSHAWSQNGSVRARLGAPVITLDESVSLTVVAVGVDGELDTTELETEFDVIGRSSSRQIENLNGEITRTASWVLELMPRETGVFTVPSVSVDGEPSQLLTLTVNPPASGAQRELFVETEVDERQPWVQSQVELTVRVFQAEGTRILDGSLEEPQAEGVQLRLLGDDRRYETARDGRAYSVLERRFALFPQQSGRVEIGPVTLVASVPVEPNQVQGFFSDTRRLTRRSQPVILNVQGRPAGGARWWLPATAVRIESDWPEGLAGTVDQPLTRSVKVIAEGVTDAQLPEPQIPAVDGLAIYADEPEQSTRLVDDKLVAERGESWAVIPEREGKLTVPPVEIEWFNTTTGRFETARLPAETLTIAASASGSARAGSPPPPVDEIESDADGDVVEIAPEVDTDADQSLVTEDADASMANTPSSADTPEKPLVTAVGPWPVLTIAAGVLGVLGWLAFAWQWYRRRRALVGSPLQASAEAVQTSGGESHEPVARSARMASSRSAVLAELRRREGTASARQLAELTLLWAARVWPDRPPRTLVELSRRIDSNELARRLTRIDAALYRPTGPERTTTSDMPDSPGTSLADLLAAVEPSPAPSRNTARQLPELW